MLRRVLVGVGVVFGVLFVIAGLYLLLLLNPEWRMPSQTGRDGVALRTISGCTEALKWEEPSRVENISRTNNTLKVIVLAKATCGAVYPVKPLANLTNNGIELSRNWWSDPIGSFAKCKCTRHIEFSVPNFENSDVAVTIASDNL